MKLSNKLASLALAVAACVSFCSFGIWVDAAPRGYGNFVSSEKNFVEKLKSRLKKIENRYRNMGLDKIEDRYRNMGLDKTKSKPIFYVEVYDRSKDVLDRYAILYVSPTKLIELKPSINKNFEYVTFEIVDERGRVYRLTERRGLPGQRVVFEPYYKDLMYVYLPSIWPMLFAVSEESFFYGELLPSFVDEGFKFEVGKKYKIRVFDSKNSLVVEDVCKFANCGGRSEKISKSVAHPRQFNRNYYRKLLNFRRKNSRGV